MQRLGPEGSEGRLLGRELLQWTVQDARGGHAVGPPCQGHQEGDCHIPRHRNRSCSRSSENGARFVAIVVVFVVVVVVVVTFTEALHIEECQKR